MENELEIVCEDCGVTFVYTPRGGRRGSIDTPPTRCSLCRAEHARSARNQGTPSYTGDPNEYRSPMACDEPEPVRPRRPRGPNPRRGNHDQHEPGRSKRRDRQMFTAVCSKCGATAHLPFQPSKFQEVLCRSCYQEKRGRGRNPPRPERT